MCSIFLGSTSLLSVILATYICADGAILSKRRATCVPWPCVSAQFSRDPTQLRWATIRDLADLIIRSVRSIPVSRTAIRMFSGIFFPLSFSASPIGEECRRVLILLRKPPSSVFINCFAYSDLQMFYQLTPGDSEVESRHGGNQTPQGSESYLLFIRFR